MAPNVPSDISQEHPFVRHLVRYGLPALILLFYTTASLRFNYSPESTFATLNTLNFAHADSLWTALLSLAHLLSLDMLLAAKVFGLFFACCAILFSYLTANEVLKDHLLAFCVALTVSMQAWLLQLAPSGSGICFALFLSLAAIFFLLRNEYILGAVFAGLATLVAWQAVGLFVVLMFDAYINSVSKNRAAKIIMSIGIVFGGVLLPWILYSLYVGTTLIPTIESLGGFPFSLHVSFQILLLTGALFVGVALLLVRDRLALNAHFPVLLWIALASFSHRNMFALTLPLVLLYIIFSIQGILLSLGKRNLGYGVAVFFVTAVLAYNQLAAYPAAKQEMDIAIVQSDELHSIAQWLKINVSDEVPVAVPIQHQELLLYFSEKKSGDNTATFNVSDAKDVDGYKVVFDPVTTTPELPSSSAHYRIWRRK